MHLIIAVFFRQMKQVLYLNSIRYLKDLSNTYFFNFSFALLNFYLFENKIGPDRIWRIRLQSFLLSLSKVKCQVTKTLYVIFVLVSNTYIYTCNKISDIGIFFQYITAYLSCLQFLKNSGGEGFQRLTQVLMQNCISFFKLCLHCI